MNNRKPFEILNGKLNVSGTNIYKARTALGYSRQYVSDRLMNMGLDISAQAVYEIENGTRSVVEYELAAIAKILKTTSNELIKEFDNYLNNF